MKPQHLILIATATSLSACAALFDAPPSTTPPTGATAAPATATAAVPAPAPRPLAAPTPPPQPVYTPVATPYPVPAAAAAVATPTLSAGPAHAGQPGMLRARPQSTGTVEAYIPAGAVLTLRVQQTNADGGWWFTEYEGKTGWVSERGLTQ
ncbi:MAG TPA: SH3 domain-containing protein [Solimonas sp.]|nr:SH3 domain-containing protein [Solimonas sp.]